MGEFLKMDNLYDQIAYAHSQWLSEDPDEIYQNAIEEIKYRDEHADL